MWRRKPREPESEIEKLLDLILENDQEEAKRRQAKAEARNVLAQEFRNRNDPPEALGLTKVVVTDQISGRLVMIKIPNEAVTWDFGTLGQHKSES